MDAKKINVPVFQPTHLQRPNPHMSTLNFQMLVVALNGDIAAVERLLAAGATDLDLDPAMAGAARYGHLAVVERLLAAGATGFDWAIESAALNGHLAVVDRLLAAGATSFNGAMARAALNGHLAVVERLLAAGATDLDAIAWAASGGHLAVVERLLAAGATNFDVALCRAQRQKRPGWNACFRALARRAPLALAPKHPRFAALVVENARDLSAADVLSRTALVPDLLEYLVKPLLRLVRDGGVF